MKRKPKNLSSVQKILRQFRVHAAGRHCFSHMKIRYAIISDVFVLPAVEYTTLDLTVRRA